MEGQKRCAYRVKKTKLRRGGKAGTRKDVILRGREEMGASGRNWAQKGQQRWQRDRDEMVMEVDILIKIESTKSATMIKDHSARNTPGYGKGDIEKTRFLECKNDDSKMKMMTRKWIGRRRGRITRKKIKERAIM